MKFTDIVIILYAAPAAYACSEGQGDPHTHDRHSRRANSILPTPPRSPLEWGDINIIHTTDSHGWLLGHQKASAPEPNYSADFGDFASFVAHMKEIAIERDVDLLLVDSGDLHDGTGLSDGFPPGGVDGQESDEIFRQLPYDLLTIGNHELYSYSVTLDMYQNFAPKFNGRYLTSNVNITVLDNHNNVINVPVGSRFAKFETRKGRQVTSLGVLFNFAGNDKNTTVQKVEDMVKEHWFTEAIREEPDLFLLAGHMPVVKDEWPRVFNAIRAVHPTTPIMILGGHTHIRDCVQLDDRSMALESGRYLETVGWLTAKLDHKGSKDKIVFSRRYLDPNRVTYEYHTGRTGSEFDTPAGTTIKGDLKNLGKKFDLDFKFGTAPHDFTLGRHPYPSDKSLLSLFAEDAIPSALAINNERASKPNLIIVNSLLPRFDIYSGPFTKNDQLTVCPYPDHFLYVPDVPISIARGVLPMLNGVGGKQRRLDELEVRERDLYALGYVDMRYKKWLEDMDQRGGMEARATSEETLGYVTHDECPGVGDDTLHVPLPFYDVPEFISSKPPPVDGTHANVDLVFVDFIQPRVLGILNELQKVKAYTAKDVREYSPVLTNQVLGLYAQTAWK